MRLVIVAHHRTAAQALRGALSHMPECTIVGDVVGRRPCGPRVASAAADVVLLDEPAVSDDALARSREVRAAAPGAKVILVAAEMEPDRLADAAAAGLDAAIARTARPEHLSALVREVVAGNVFHAFSRPPAPQRDRGEAKHLTSRELEILRLVAGGASNGRVAATLWVTEQTVKFHLSNVYLKLGVANRTEASRYAHVNGIVASGLPTPLERLAA